MAKKIQLTPDEQAQTNFVLLDTAAFNAAQGAAPFVDHLTKTMIACVEAGMLAHARQVLDIVESVQAMQQQLTELSESAQDLAKDLEAARSERVERVQQ